MCVAVGTGLSQNVAVEERLVPHRPSLIVVLLAKRDGVDPRRVPRKLSARIQPVDEIRDRSFATNAASVAKDPRQLGRSCRPRPDEDPWWRRDWRSSNSAVHQRQRIELIFADHQNKPDIATGDCSAMVSTSNMSMRWGSRLRLTLGRYESSNG